MKHLEIFKKEFMNDKYKEYPNKLEYKSQNLDISLPQARNIIKKFNLDLEARTMGNMAQYRSFEVIEKLKENLV